jgi:5'-deoxynucleotidase YfbR-like HD superfamily hydrolase
VSLHNTYESGRTLRYHANPLLARYGQTVADHAWGVAAIICCLHPNPSMPLIRAALFHDAGERWVGDLPYPFKVRAPEFARLHSDIEDEIREEMGIPSFNLTATEEKWLKLADRMEAYLFCKMHNPDLVETALWVHNNETMVGMSEELGCTRQVKEITGVGC